MDRHVYVHTYVYKHGTSYSRHTTRLRNFTLKRSSRRVRQQELVHGICESGGPRQLFCGPGLGFVDLSLEEVELENR